MPLEDGVFVGCRTVYFDDVTDFEGWPGGFLVELGQVFLVGDFVAQVDVFVHFAEVDCCFDGETFGVGSTVLFHVGNPD